LHGFFADGPRCCVIDVTEAQHADHALLPVEHRQAAYLPGLHDAHVQLLLIQAVDDTHWQTLFEVVLKPNPLLTPSQQQTIAMDYQMTKGKAVLPIRRALLYYFAKRLRLDMDPDKDRPAEKPVVIENWKEFEKARTAAMA
jgi:hypothetical protein